MAAQVTVQVTGGQPRVIEGGVSTVRDAMRSVGISGNYSATVNGNPASLDSRISDYSFVTFSPSVKGGRK